MAWEFDGRVGSAVIDGVTQNGLAVLRDSERALIDFAVIPRPTFGPGEQPPMLEHHLIPEAEFTPAQ